MVQNILLSFMLVLIPVTMSYILTPFYIKLHEEKKYTVSNYQGKRVATAGGLILWLVLLSVYPLYYYYSGMELLTLRVMFFYVTGITFLGLLDDFRGDKICKGFRGHCKALWEKRVVTTGLFKAAGGFLLGTSASALAGGGGWIEWVAKGIFLSLFSNFFNLLDTRPARAAGVFIFFSLVSMLIFRELLFILFPLWSALYIYLWQELARRIMLGDTGAYLLGGALGFPLALRLTTGQIILFNIALIILHCYCEKFSLNKLIDSKKLFHFEALKEEDKSDQC
jgi:UDP-N-acetylmuramyl pentapeptide phosphotransferase/UDP-N-acetylglucosamine-1-phosphate transferase